MKELFFYPVSLKLQQFCNWALETGREYSGEFLDQEILGNAFPSALEMGEPELFARQLNECIKYRNFMGFRLSTFRGGIFYEVQRSWKKNETDSWALFAKMQSDLFQLS